MSSPEWRTAGIPTKARSSVSHISGSYPNAPEGTANRYAEPRPNWLRVHSGRSVPLIGSPNEANAFAPFGRMRTAGVRRTRRLDRLAFAQASSAICASTRYGGLIRRLPASSNRVTSPTSAITRSLPPWLSRCTKQRTASVVIGRSNGQSIAGSVLSFTSAATVQSPSTRHWIWRSWSRKPGRHLTSARATVTGRPNLICTQCGIGPASTEAQKFVAVPSMTISGLYCGAQMESAVTSTREASVSKATGPP